MSEEALWKRLLLVTGTPGVGKTTLLLRVVEAMKARGYSVGGMVTREVRISGVRVGFEVTDLSNGNKGWLASVHEKGGPQVGKYRVNVDDLNNVGVRAVLNACEKSDIVIVDEIGPMELVSERFKEAVNKAVEGKTLVVSTIHWKMSGEFMDGVKKREDAQIHILTRENQEQVFEEVITEALEFLSRADA